MTMAAMLAARTGDVTARPSAASTTSVSRFKKVPWRPIYSPDCVRAARSAPVRGDHAVYCRDDIVDIGVAHPGVDRQRNRPLILRVRNGKVERLEAVRISIVRVEVQRDEMHARADVQRRQLADERG